MSFSLRLDPIFRRELSHSRILDVQVQLIRSGCAGTKINVTPLPKNGKKSLIASEPSEEGIRCWINPEDREKLDGAQIARAKGRFFLVTDAIQTRCGCGSSFSFEKKVIKTDLAKIHRIRNILQTVGNKSVTK